MMIAMPMPMVVSSGSKLASLIACVITLQPSEFLDVPLRNKQGEFGPYRLSSPCLFRSGTSKNSRLQRNHARLFGPLQPDAQDLGDLLHAVGRAVLRRVGQFVPVRIVKVNDVDGRDADGVQRGVVV